MYSLKISFPNSSDNVLDNFGIASRSREYCLSDEVEVCKVIKCLSHLKPVVTLCQISVLTADEVLKDFEAKQV